MTSTAILIPARFASTRFPDKPLCDLGGKKMIERVCETCVSSGYDTYVLTDDTRMIFEADLDADVIVNKTDFANGTERCAAAAERLTRYDQFINVQGDMPDVTLQMIKRIDINTKITGVATAWTEMDPLLQSDPNTVKVVHNNVFAHWFGRGMTCGAHHLGIYGYTRKALAAYRKHPSKYELHEGLEQLRWYELNQRIGITRCDFDGIEINTLEDMEKWNESWKDMGNN